MQIAIHDFEIRYEDESSGICGPYRILGLDFDFASHPCILCFNNPPVARRCYNVSKPQTHVEVVRNCKDKDVFANVL